MGDTALDTAALLMRGISEEDQVAMAIAASLQDQNTNDNEENDDVEEDTENDDNDSEFVDEDGESDELNDNELLQDANDLDIVEEEMEEEADQEASQSSYESSESLDERRSDIMDEENKSTLDLVTKQKFMELDKPNEARNMTAVAVEQL